MSTPSDWPSPAQHENQDKVLAEEHILRREYQLFNTERGILYRWLSLAFQDPAQGSAAPLMDLTLQEACRAAAETLRSFMEFGNGDSARGEVPLACLDIQPSLDLLPSSNQDLVEHYDELFGLLLSRDCPPYETEYCPQTFSVHRSHQLADIAGFYQAFGLEPSRANPERADHIALELEFMSWLILKEERAVDSGIDGRSNAQICREAQQRFLADHLLWWAPAFGFAVRKKVDHIIGESELPCPPRSFYGATAQLLAAFTRAERISFGIHPPQRLISPNPSNEDPESNSCEGCELLAP